MKKQILTLALLIVTAISALAQAPQKFNYQGVARNTTGTPLASTAVGLRLTIHDGSAGGTVVYQETHTPTTNAFGLYNVAVGAGTVVSGTFASIAWGTGSKYLEVEIDPAGGSSYTSAGNSQLLSVPYAMYAASAPSSGGTVTSVAAGTGLSGGTITSSGTISMPSVGTAGTYGSATQVPVFTTDAQGRVTSVTNTTISAGGTGTVTSVNTSAPLTGGPITSTGTIGLATTGTAGTYGSATQVPVITTDAYGRVTGVTNTTITMPTVSGTTNYVSKFTGTSTLGNSSLFDNGTVGVGTITPTNTSKMNISGVGTYSGTTPYYQAGLVVDGSTTGSASGIYSAGGWRGVFGHNLGTIVATEAIGVLGRQEGSSYTGTGYGVKGENTGTGGTANYGVFGIASGSTGTGVGGSISGGGTAVSGKITSGGGTAILGTVTGSTGVAGKFDPGTSGAYGVIVPNGGSGFGTSIPTNMAKLHVSGLGTYSVSPIYQAGIVADGGSTSGSASAIYGEAGWRGVYGRNVGASTGVDAIGVAGKLETGSSYTNGYGVKGEALGVGPTNFGVYGNASGGTSNNYGIYGTNTGTGYAGYFSGNVRITGSITKGSGTFLIDHPLDPENKYLYHSFVESPDMMNVYNGNIVTNASGEATVTMPDYFEVLNRDFRYQLTVIGTFAQAIVMEEMQGNTFKIKTDKPNVKVSWQVTGIRQDKYANAHRVVPEVEKEAQFKGHYLHAAEWGQPHEKSFDAITTPVAPENNMPQGTK